MTTFKEELRVEAQGYADKIDQELRIALTNLEQVLEQSMAVVRNLVRPAITALDHARLPN